MDTDSLAKLVFGIIGGLGIFLLGMKNMSEGMQAVAGAGLRRMIGLATDNRFLAAGVGTIVTTVIQSSSITTVMVVGFVNSGVMTLNQAIGVIMGANIGTTITGWIVTLPIGKYGLPLLGSAALIYLFAKGDRWRYWAMFFMGVGMVFFGLVLMKDACKLIRDVPEFEAWFHRFNADGYAGVIMCQLVGCLLTMLVQSSSATLTITISLATQGVIPYETAAALVLGENLGTTVTAYLASLGATTVARRAAYFHVIFNLLGVCWITIVFPWYTDFVQSIVTEGIDRQIAATHTMFNVANTLVFVSFVPMFGNLLERLVPAKGFKEKPKLTNLDVHILDTPALAIEQSRYEILKMAEGCSKMMAWLNELIGQRDQDRALSERLRHREKVLDSVQDEITHFVTDLLAGNVPHSVAEEARQQLRLADEYESISDYIDSILKADQRLRKDELRLTEKQRLGLRELHRGVAEYLDEINQAYRDQNPNVHTKLDAASKGIRRLIKRLRREHLDDLSTETIPPQVSVAFLAALNAYSRVRDHAQNIGEVIAGEK
ncbi:MAG: Na/Pi cotransporter family protein [Planctomycetota bacterium]|nr:MAG: Na/Pi cotransporter family protein [Planctomycetota bacterium]REJ95531.1 MAG: Na/Pi cotransporter family protein [Planctomycetota bacterium]REK21917.1 MAG: Na/Pi cotransporter family protein [Planctomycetota bacterium]REK32171.1 MAG: Na/Pi cotransporter family protein [Planctomycetota bacterium]